MKKFLFFIALCQILSISSAFASVNPAFQGRENQIMIHGGLSTRSDGIERYREIDTDNAGVQKRGNYKFNLGYAMISYSQPTEFFRISARRNLELGGFIGRKKGIVEKDGVQTSKDFSQYSQVIFGASEDIVLGWKYCYFTIGLGAYIKGKTDDRVGSKFTFGERFGIGTNIGAANLEAFVRHYSNGSLTEKNSGQNFVGLSLGFKF